MLNAKSTRPNPLPQIDHVIVLMLENRSFDNLVGWLYDDANPPQHIIGPHGTAPHYKGLAGANFSNPTAFKGGTPVPVVKGTQNMCIPSPDPNESFKHMNQQLFGANVSGPNWLPTKKADGQNRRATMNGFVVDYGEAIADYVEATGSQPGGPTTQQIMQTYAPAQVPAMSELARNFAISDEWHASNPTQTLPNRAFMAAGTSEGRVNNLPFPFYTAKTIFNVFDEYNVDWKVYKSSTILPSLTRTAMVRLWDPLLFEHFHSIDRFYDDAANGHLPPYSFLEPLFIQDRLFHESEVTSDHPPTDVGGGEQFLAQVWEAVRNSKHWDSTLFIVTFDEHGGCADHVPPPWTATPPDSQSTPGDEGFGFNRFGVRIPTILASPYIEPRTVFRADTSDLPFDHTSTLATLLDWQGIQRSALGSKRVNNAPTFGNVLTRSTPRTTTKPLKPNLPLEHCVENDAVLTDLEKGILGAFELYLHHHMKPFAELKTMFDAFRHAGSLPTPVASILDKVKTRAEAASYLHSVGPVEKGNNS